MVRRFIIVAALASLTMAVAGTAWADQSPAINENACDAAGGEFSQSGSGNQRINTCIVDGDVYTYVTKNPPGKAKWEVEVQDTDTHEAGPGADVQSGSLVDSSSEVTACYLPNGKLKKNLDGDHCQYEG